MVTPQRNTKPEDDPTTTQERGVDNRCAKCGRQSDLPFCPHDGTVIRVFPVGEHYRAERLEMARRHTFVYFGSHVSGKAVRVIVARETGPSRALRRSAGFKANGRVPALFRGHDETFHRDTEVHNPPDIKSIEDELKGGPMSPTRVAETLIGAAQVLKEAADERISHGGLELPDVWSETGSFIGTRIMGFGFGPAEDTTPAPEYSPTTPANEAADVYSFGQLAYRLLTANTWNQNIPAAPSSFQEMPAGLNELVLSCLSSAPGERPRWAQIVAVLDRFVSVGATDVATVDPLIGTMVGSYRIVSLLGQGGMGAVYKAVHPRIGTHVAVKILHAEIASKATVLRRFEREARASSTIGSPHIPKFFDFGTLSDGRPYAVLEFFNGESVAERIDNQGAMPLAQTREALIDAAVALQGAHDHAIIHRDVKPDNLFLAASSDGRESIRLLDFGIAKTASPEGTQLTHAGSFLGTPVYCAPEQMYGLDPTPQMDIYALGATAFEMLSGAIPYGGDVQAVLKAKAARTPPDKAALAHLPRVVQRTVLKAMAYEPKDRYPSMRAFADAVRTWPHEVGSLSSATRVPTVGSKLGVKIAAAIALVLTLGAAVWFGTAEEVVVEPDDESSGLARPESSFEASPPPEPTVPENPVEPLDVDDPQVDESPETASVETPLEAASNNVETERPSAMRTRASSMRPRRVLMRVQTMQSVQMMEPRMDFPSMEPLRRGPEIADPFAD